MAFHEDPGVREEAPKASGPRFFFRIIAQEAAALLKLNLLFLLFCLPAVTIPPALLALFQVVRRMPAERTVRCWSQFWDAFRHRWRTAWGAFLLTVLPLTAAGYGAWFYLHFAQDNPVSCLPFAFCAVVFLTVLGIGSIAGGLSSGLEAAKTVLLMTGSMGMFLLAGMLLVKGKKPEALSNSSGWRRHFRAAGVKTVLAAGCLAFVLAAAAADWLLRLG